MRGIIGAAAIALLAGCAAQDTFQAQRAVLFGFDRETLDAEAIETLANVSDDVLEAGVGSTMIIGHTDTAGDVEFNEGLSERRAQTVRRDLIARGVPARTITTMAFGQRDLAVETPDGTRERANRRVVIELDEIGAFDPIDRTRPFSFPLPPEAPQD